MAALSFSALVGVFFQVKRCDPQMFSFVMGVLCYLFAFKAFTWVSLALNKKIEQSLPQ
jgi:hypothetical protein